jgi:hypothetical protein
VLEILNKYFYLMIRDRYLVLIISKQRNDVVHILNLMHAYLKKKTQTKKKSHSTSQDYDTQRVKANKNISLL